MKSIKEFFRDVSASGMVFGLCSIFGFILTLVYTVYSISSSDFPLTDKAIILVLGAINAILSYSVFILNKDSSKLVEDKIEHRAFIKKCKKHITQLRNLIKYERYKALKVNFELHNIQDQLRDKMVEISNFHHYFLLNDQEVPPKDDVLDLLKMTKLYNLYLVNCIKDMFESLTGDACSVCIKIIDKNDDNDIIVETLIRDPHSYRERKASDSLNNEPFLWYENSAFKCILSSKTDSTYYVSDNLSDQKEYSNINNNWKSFYNATIVTPIRITLTGEEYGDNDSNVNVIGFICIDNFKGGFDNKTCTELLSSIADGHYHYFNLSAEAVNIGLERIKSSEG